MALLAIHPEKFIILKDTCIPVFIAALFTIARTWKRPKCPSIEEWIEKMWYIHTVEYYSALKRNKTGLFVEVWMDLESVISRNVISMSYQCHIKGSKSEREKNCISMHTVTYEYTINIVYYYI